ncbi:hypothetical protein BP5796_11099 [Coleophoma crateriformis]|uniref:Shugoshin n=1 Tax=Coleophoma crateriformis TaxID=565419 RepID=A0A3D8QM01_9HELO|nr:hypothetical protein BP5796_11099 [Coleophoma crateriformis]
MARLNEPAASTESLESLKRKFMRQNRDIARVNSTQSQRIRNLENEVSRMLADNLRLREQIIRQQNELENNRSQRIVDHAGAIKSQLEAKLLEIGALITGLGDEAPQQKKPSPKAGPTSRKSLSKSPDQKNWKNLCSLSDAVAGHEGRLPPIPENKTYPRRTLELQELTAILAEQAAETTDSPEIGPPPISKFVDEDPVKIDLPNRSHESEGEDPGSLDPALSINLEQRKKRRESGSVETKKITSQTDENREDAEPLRIGAKRKLSVREDDDSESSRRHKEASDDSFLFARLTGEVQTRLGPPAEKTKTQNAREMAVANGGSQKKITSEISARRVLAPKSVNNSPRKVSKPKAVDEVKAAKAELAKKEASRDRPRALEKKSEPIPVEAETIPILDPVDIQVEPETPAALDLFSPQSSLPSTARAESRDTPPPTDLGASAEAQRPSRRARGAVSYAEPNLRDKMRRPTKELVDAVAREEARRTASIKLEDEVQRAIKIKAEPETDDAWKSLPMQSSIPVEAGSPLSGKTPPTILPSGLISHRKRRESSLQQGEAEQQRPGSGGAISALLAGTRRSRTEVKECSPSDDAISPRRGNPDIYEFRTASPTVEEARALEGEKEVRPVSRTTSRRASSTLRGSIADRGETSEPEGLKRSTSLTSRRRTSTLGLKAPMRTIDPAKKVKEESGHKSEGEVERGDRVSRRRSMML